ncbi:DsbA family protein [Streptomyces sp. NPDC015346]|uniref:DsbA family protein n=1 Tax=Streptomyces sp. NPDC015346 TaxID=3364954 RepID=UPI0036FA7725
MLLKHRILGAIAIAAFGLTATSCGERTGHAKAADIPESLSSDGSSIVIGSPAAKTTVQLYVDPRCSTCEEFETVGSGPKLRSMAQRGEAKVQYSFMASSGIASQKVVNALRAALEEGKFVEYHEALYGDHAKEPAEGVTDAHLLTLASRVEGLRGERFDTAVRTMKYRSFVGATEKASQGSGSVDKPTMEINDVPLPEHQDDTILFDAEFLTRYIDEVANAEPS